MYNINNFKRKGEKMAKENIIEPEEKKYYEWKGFSLDFMLNKLIKAKKIGVLNSCDYNGHKFYSDKFISKEVAYFEIYGMSQNDYIHYSENRSTVIENAILKSKDLVTNEKFKDWVEVLIVEAEPLKLKLYDYAIKISFVILGWKNDDKTLKEFLSFSNEDKLKIKELISTYFESSIMQKFSNVFDGCINSKALTKKS